MCFTLVQQQDTLCCVIMGLCGSCGRPAVHTRRIRVKRTSRVVSPETVEDIKAARQSSGVPVASWSRSEVLSRLLQNCTPSLHQIFTSVKKLCVE